MAGGFTGDTRETTADIHNGTTVFGDDLCSAELCDCRNQAIILANGYATLGSDFSDAVYRCGNRMVVKHHVSAFEES